MTTADPAATFEAHRRRLLGLAYRMLGSLTEAEDAVQEAYLRWHDADRDAVVDPRAFLVRTTTRICLDVLKSARVQREEYVGPWLPEPVIDTAALAADAETALAEDLSVALLLALERLSPLERAAFLLHDVFDYPFAEVANTLGRNEAACRQLASRARSRVRDARPDSAAPARATSPEVSERHAALVSAFMSASRSGDVEALSRLLARDVRFMSDGGGKVPAAINVVDGAERVAALVTGVVRKGLSGDVVVRFATINGLPGLVMREPGGLVQTAAFEIEDDLVKAIYIVRNPDKVRHVTVG